MKVTMLLLPTASFALLLSTATATPVGINPASTIRAGKTLRAVDSTLSAGAPSKVLASPPSTFVFEPLQPGGNDRDDRNHDGDHDRDRDHDRDHDRAPAPAPEPLTALLFGAAMLIGGGILRRQHRRTHS